VVLLSGGIDSVTALAIAIQDRGSTPVAALSFDYNQRHAEELNAARAVAQHFGVEHYVQRIDLRMWGGSALTSDTPVPKDRPLDKMAEGIPITYVPARNTVFLAFALSLAEAIEADVVFGGWNVLDYSGYPDCRPDYIDAMQRVYRLGTKAGVEGRPIRIRAPLIEMNKAEIIKAGLALKAPYQLTWSCYDPQYKGFEVVPCGRCDSCLLRAKGFAEAGISDPALVAESLL
jgi:7-cyano-7-deazaguanine synthase